MEPSDNSLRVLGLIESDADFLRITHYLEYLGLPVHAEHVTNLSQLKNQIMTHPWSLVIAMSNVSDAAPKDALQEVKKLRPDLPFVLISNGIGEEEVVDLMKAGAEDVVLLSRSHRLLQAVRRILKDQEVRGKEVTASKIAHEAYAAREQMLAIVSHDIKNPLSAIQMEAQMLLRVADRHGQSILGNEVKVQANRILKTTDRLKALIIDLLDRNKTAEGLASLNKDLSEAVKLFQDVVDANRPLIRQKELIVKTDFPASCEALIDKSKMFQVLSNLLCNAIKFAPEKGEISVSIKNNEHEIIFSVCDNGQGLNPKDLNKVFEKYWTGGVSGQSGTGLGLFICKTIVEAHGGNIGVENRQQGSHFWFSIPKTQVMLSPHFWVKDQEKKILIIDDDDDLREVICWALNKEGYSVHSYGSATEALDGLKRGRHQPQLMVVDFHMDGMKGSEFLKLKKDILEVQVRECPVLMISASPEEVENEVEPGLCQWVFTKPLDLEGLVDHIKQYMQ